MQENLKERLEDFQDLLFLKRLVEQNIEEESILAMPIRFSVQDSEKMRPVKNKKASDEEKSEDY